MSPVMLITHSIHIDPSHTVMSVCALLSGRWLLPLHKQVFMTSVTKDSRLNLSLNTTYFPGNIIPSVMLILTLFL